MDQERALTERVFKNLMEWVSRLVSYEHKLYLKLDNKRVKKYLYGYVITFHFSIIIWIIGSILLISFFNMILNSNILVKLLIKGTIFLPLFLHTRLKTIMENKTLLDLYILSKNVNHLVKIKLKSLMEEDLIYSFLNNREFRSLRSRLDNKTRTIFNRVQKSFTKVLKITTSLFCFEIIFALFIIFALIQDSWIYEIGFLSFVVFFFFISTIQKDIDDELIKYQVQLDRHFAFIDYIIQNDSFSPKIAQKYLRHYYYYDFKNFKILVKCVRCKNLIRIDNLSQKYAYCYNCDIEFELKNILVYVANFKLTNTCVRCGKKNKMILCPPYDNEIICEDCGYNRGKIYPPVYIKIFSMFLGEIDQIGVIFTSHNHNSSAYHFILYYDGDENVLLPIPDKYELNFFLRIPLENFKDLSENISNKYNWVEKSIGDENNSFYIPVKLNEPNEKERFIDLLKGPRLENDIRRLLYRKYNYNMKLDGKEVKLSKENRKYMIQEGCWKNMQTRTKEIDIFGYKEVPGRITYVIGECKYQKKAISLNKTKQFIIVADILAGQLQEEYTEKSKEVEFYIIIASYSGFPDKMLVQNLLSKYWNHGMATIKEKKIELLAFDDFKRLFKRYNISTTPYTHRI